MPQKPHCLDPVVATSAENPGVELDSIVDEWPNEFFALSCPCSGLQFTVQSFFSRSACLEQDRAYGPISVACCACQRSATIFDPALHGYDVEIDHFPPHAPYLGDWRVFQCSSCASKAFGLIARFQYPANAGDPHLRPDGSSIPRHDLFSYFTLIGECGTCGSLSTVSSVECA